MDEINFSAAGVSTATAITKPATEITKILSSELLKQYELNEYCNFIESDMDKWYKKVETLTSAKNENTKILTEYKSRNKINAINSGSLLQALNELYKYKSELKSTYIATEKALKMKQLKYKKITSSYESAWQEALSEYNADPVFVELLKIQQENALLEKEVETQEKLNITTEIQLSDLRKTVRKNFREKTIEFSNVMLQYKQFMNLEKRKGQTESQGQNPKENFQFKYFSAIPQCKHSDNNNDDTIYTCSIDVSVFDDITVPSENLESQNLEEEVSLVEVSREQEPSEYLSNYPQTIQQKTSEEGQKENSVQADDSESHYFRPQPSETTRPTQSEQPQTAERSKENFNKHLDNSGEKLKSVNNAIGLQKGDNGEESSRDMQMECDEFVSDVSYEKQVANHQREESQYQKTSSFSSEDLPSSGEILQESPEPEKKGGEQNNKSEPEKNDFKTFTGFFTMGNDQDTSKPSIFKLF